MKNSVKKVVYILMTMIFLFTIIPVSSANAAGKTMSIRLRIEGIEKNLFYGTEVIPYTDTLTLAQALSYIDTKEDGIKIGGIDTGYIKDINGESAGKFGGWDGWLYKVNGTDPTVSIDALQLSNKDSVILYYGDPYGVGMQFPVADTTKLSKGVITFTSSDTTYDANYNPVTKVNPVKGATVSWSNAGKVTKYVTDAKGSIKIASNQLTKGAHIVQITKTGDTKLPMVLRFAPDYKLTIKKTVAKKASDQSKKSAVTNQSSTQKIQKTWYHMLPRYETKW